MARVLILRPQPEANETAEALRALGHQPILLPLADIVLLPVAPPAGDFGGFVATSRHAAGRLGEVFPGDPRPVLCTGERTRQALAEAGFPAAEAGPGTAAGLADRVCELAAAGGQPLLYAAGRVRTPDLERAAAASLVVWEVYDTVPVRPSDADASQALVGADPSHVLLLSVGQAAGFSSVWRDITRSAGGEVPALLCLSERISRQLSAELRPFARISPQPTLSSLFDRHLRPSLG